jgi:hypothetical protein
MAASSLPERITEGHYKGYKLMRYIVLNEVGVGVDPRIVYVNPDYISYWHEASPYDQTEFGAGTRICVHGTGSFMVAEKPYRIAELVDPGE